MSATRVNPYPLPDLLAALEQVQAREQNDATEIATGSSINFPSDDPTGAAQLSELTDESTQVDSFQQSVGSVNSLLSTADSTLNSVIAALQTAITAGTEGANGTLSDSDRANVAAQVRGIQSQLLSLANTSYQGQYIFAGTANVQPFVADANSPSSVTYNGNADSNEVTIGNGYQLQVNLPGSQIFTAAGGNVFQSIQDLITALENNTNIGNAVTEVDNAYNSVNAQRVFYGNGISQLTSQSTYLNTEKLDLTQQANTVGGADLAAVASQLANDETALNATVEAIAKIPQNSLFDYLK